jgi:hypothetical protein
MSTQIITETQSGSNVGSAGLAGTLRLQVPSDYDLVTTESPDDQVPRLIHDNPVPEHVGNPPHWPTDQRNVPPYRPVNRNLDFSTRPAGTTPPIFVFIFTMLGGCHVLAVSFFWRELTIGNGSSLSGNYWEEMYS